MASRPTSCSQLLCVSLALTAATTGACRGGSSARVMSDSTFVAAMASLRHLPPVAMTDSASRQRARDSIMKHYHVTQAQLESAASNIATNPDHASAIWDEIGRRQK